MHAPPLMLNAPLARPQRGGSTRVQLGSSELVLENVRGGYSLLWSDGREARRYALGLEAEGELSLELRAPSWPLQVVPRDVLTVVPGARWAGYVQVPLVPTLVWSSVQTAPTALIVLHPRDLTTQWHDAIGHVCSATSALHVRFPMRSGEPRAVVPLRVANHGSELLSPAALPMHVTDGELRVMRDAVVACPRRLSWNGNRFVSQSVTPSGVKA